MFKLDVNLLDSETYRHGTPNAVFAALRREAPIYFHEREGGKGLWCVSKYADIAFIGADYARFSSREGTGLHLRPEGKAMADRALTAMDPPRHTRMRLPIQRAFTPARMHRAEEIVDHYADHVLNSVIEEGRCDSFEVAATLPVSMISTLMALPREMHADVLRWTNLTFGQDEYAASPAEVANAF